MQVLIAGGIVIAMDEARSVRSCDVLIEGQRIAWMGPAQDVPRVPRGVKRERLDATGAVVVPGFVQAHVHLCQVLFRGLADDLPLLTWLRERIWPLEGAHDDKSVRTSAELGLAELIASGTTCILDMGTVHHHDQVFEAMARFGMRGASGKAMMDIAGGAPRGLRETTRASLDESDRLRARYHGQAGGRLRYAYAPRFVLSCSERLLRGVAERVQGSDVLAHTHVAEHADERYEVKKALGVHDFEALSRAGLRGPNTVMAHGVQLTAREQQSVARFGTRLVHCPSANLKLASGIADVVGMRKRGVVVGLGADGAPCNNRLDALSELRLCALLAKVRRKNAASLNALEALALLTIDGARCLGREDEIGSLEVGKRADVVVVAIDRVEHAPALDPVSALVYAANGRDVRHVLIDGEIRVRKGELLEVDRGALVASAKREAARVAKRAGL